MGGEVHLVVWADSLAHDDVMIVSGLIVDGGLGPTMLVVPEGDFKRLAELSKTGRDDRFGPIARMRPVEQLAGCRGWFSRSYSEHALQGQNSCNEI